MQDITKIRVASVVLNTENRDLTLASIPACVLSSLFCSTSVRKYVTVWAGEFRPTLQEEGDQALVHLPVHFLPVVRLLPAVKSARCWTLALALLGRKTKETFQKDEKALTRGSKMSVTSWFLVSSSGTRHRLPREMIFVGRDDCELMLQSRSVDKQHAVINYDPKTDEHTVKDLGSLNGTFVNDLRIPDQTYITLKLSDVIRFGYDILLSAHSPSFYFLLNIVVLGQHKVPEEALKHEKYTSQLQLSIKALEAKAKEKLLSPEKNKACVSKVKERVERKAHSFTAATEAPISKPTPLYGQPSWWGEDEDPASKKAPWGGKQREQDSPDAPKESSRYELNGSLSDSQAKSIFSYRREPSCFEIPTKELQHPAKKMEPEIHEVPTKDIPDLPESLPSTPTPPVVQSHASFTIEFDDCTPGKMKIKDHITKFSFRQQKKLPHTQTAAAPTEVMSAESKVADWLVQSNASMVRRKSQAEDLYSTISDPTVQKLRTNWDNGTHSDLGTPGANVDDLLQSDVQPASHVSQHQVHSPPQRYASPESEEPVSPEPPLVHGQTKTETKQSFIVEFYDDNQRKKRSQSFTNNTTAQPTSGLKAEAERSRKSPSPTGESALPTQRYTVPLKGSESPGPQRAGSLRRERTEERICTSFSSRSTSSVSTRPFSSVGRRSKLARDFTAEFLKQEKQSASAEGTMYSPRNVKTTLPIQNSPPSSIPGNQPQTSSPIHHPVPLNSTVTTVAHDNSEVKTTHCSRNEEEDSLSDAGTYTIEADVQDKELEEARSKIDQIQSPKWMSCWASLADSYTECPPTFQMEPSVGGIGHKTMLRQTQSVGPSGEMTEGPGVAVMRQESFTTERPSSVQLPHISSPESASHDTHSYLKQTEDVLAALEAKLQTATPSPVADSASAESDVDTSSSVSQQSNKTKPGQTSKKPSSTFHREQSSASITSQDSNVQSSVSSRRALHSDTFRKPSVLRHRVGNQGSIDLSDDHQSSSRHCSDQESNHTQVSRKYTAPLQKEPSKGRVSQALSRANSLSAPRATRASMLRRARLGESDNEGTETDKASQEAAKQQEPKKLSRWDMLAMPRKRANSMNAPSDTEASSGPQGTGRSTGTESTSSRRGSISGNKPTERPQKAPLNKTPVTRVRASSAKYTTSTASSRRRQKGSDYTSTSDEEYDSTQVTAKPKRSQPSSASHSPRSQPRPQPVVALRPASRNRDSEEENHEGEAYHNWSSHSAEIARLSQDLAKDLATLAREIHDVAGDGDSLNPGAESSAPVSAVRATEQIIGHIPETSSNPLRGAPAGPAEPVPPNHQQSIRKQDQSEEAHTNNQLDPVSQVICSIRENTEELGEKIKFLFQDKMEMWEEIETKIFADDDMTVVKTQNKEIASILLELRRVQLQLEVMNTVVKPSDQGKTSSTSSSSGVRPSRVVSSQDWRTSPSVSRRGGGPRPGDRKVQSFTSVPNQTHLYMRIKMPATPYGRLRDEDYSKKKPTSCVVLAVVLACLTALGILLAVAVLERPCSSENGEKVLPLDSSSDICSMELVESIPMYMVYNHSATFGVPLTEVWKGLLAMATEQLDVVSFYWTLTGGDIGVNSSSAFPGTFILTELEALPARNVSVRALISKQTVQTNSTDLKNLQEKGVQVREVDFRHFTHGVLHSKFWIVDRKHVFIGSANMDWRALTQVKELGVVIYNCSTLATDLEKIFNSYWEMGLPNSTLPDPWPSKYDTNINKERPLLLNARNISSQIYITGTPPLFCPVSRTLDLDAILSSISEAEHYIDVAVMEYFPTIRFDSPQKFWPVLDDAIKTAALDRSLKIRMLISCGRNSDPQMLPFLQSLAALDTPSLHINIKIKLFIVPVGNQTDIPFSRVNHNKYMVTDKVAYISTSNWSGDYFTSTGGVSLVISQHAPHPIWNRTLQSQLKAVFDRDWTSQFAVYLDDLGHHPDCALVT
uniref:Uncharacterized protein n=1 Tax=Knipowitschia caucasica TaxID=637954 RepID=A0AAV2JI85_KNICA